MVGSPRFYVAIRCLMCFDCVAYKAEGAGAYAHMPLINRIAERYAGGFES